MKIKKEYLRQLFKRRANCYAITSDNSEHEAITERAFLELMDEIFAININNTISEKAFSLKNAMKDMWIVFKIIRAMFHTVYKDYKNISNKDYKYASGSSK